MFTDLLSIAADAATVLPLLLLLIDRNKHRGRSRAAAK